MVSLDGRLAEIRRMIDFICICKNEFVVQSGRIKMKNLRQGGRNGDIKE